MANVLMCVYGTENIMHYEGRLLGLATQEMFAKYIKSKPSISKLFTSGTTRCKDIAERGKVSDLRIVMVIKAKNDNPTGNRKIFFSEPLEMLVEEDMGKLAIRGKDETYYEILEMDS